jgi:hypothetical protein
MGIIILTKKQKMKRYTDKDGLSTGWLSNPPTLKELERLNVKHLLMIARTIKGFKKVLVEFISNQKAK